MQSIEWRAIPGLEGRYEASSTGQIRSVDRVVHDEGGRNGGKRKRVFKGKPRKAFDDTRGYLGLSITVGGKNRRFKVHRLVAAAFHGPPPPFADACHNNGDRRDNRAENLRWDTRGGNLSDKAKHGTHYQAAKTHCDSGHEFTEDNTYRSPQGFRTCLTCRSERSRAYRARKAIARAASREE